MHVLRWTLLRRVPGGAAIVLGAVALSLVVIVAVLALAERRLVLPGELTRRIEARIDAQLTGIDIALRQVAVGLDRQAVPRLWLRGVRLTAAGGVPLAEMSEIAVAFDPAAALRGRAAPRELGISGANLVLRRDAEGAFAVGFERGDTLAPAGLGALFDAMDAAMAAPPFDRIERAQLSSAVVTLEDARFGRVWQATDARLDVERTARGIRVSALADIFDGRDALGSAQLSIATRAEDGRAEMRARLDGVPAADIAAQTPVLAFLGVLDAPLSGALRTTLDAEGAVATLAGKLEIGQGAVRPRPGTPPIAFDAARAYFDYDPARQRLAFTEVSARSAAGSGRLSGHADLVQSAAGRGPAHLAAQFRIEELQLDAPALFEAPVSGAGGSLDLRIGLDPFRLEIGQLVLPDPGGDPDRHLRATGRVAADAQGWDVAVDLSAAGLSAERLRALWPLPVARKVRQWVERNLIDGEITRASAALRYATGDPKPELTTTFAFRNARVRALRTLPPIEGMAGYGSLIDNRFAVEMEAGTMTMPQRAPLDMAGSAMVIPDTRIKPSPARFALDATGELRSLLAVLDAPPFAFLEKAGRTPDLARGRITAAADLGLILKKGLTPDEITLDASATVDDLSSDVIVAGRALRSDRMEVRADLGRIRATGRATLDGVRFDGSWEQALSGEDRGHGRVEGRIALTPSGLERFGIALPEGLMEGAGEGDLVLDLTPGAPAQIEVRTDLRGIGLDIPAVDWSKPPAAAGAFRIAGRLGPVPEIDALSISAPGLEATGRIRFSPGPKFAALAFDRVALGGWLDTAVTIRSRGAGAPPGIAVRGGEIDIRRARLGGGGTGRGDARGPVTLRLDRLTVTDTFGLTDFAVDLAPGDTLAGAFQGRVNGGASVTGRLEGGSRGVTIRIGSRDAGRVLRDAGLIERVEGGTMAVTLTPTGREGSYDGQVRVSGPRLRDAPAAVELLSAISVVGLVEQLQGRGIVFDEVDADFRLTPQRITLYRASATGSSLGISMDGVYDPVRRVMDMQGVVSPVYLLNRVGAAFTRRGEGLFGVNFTLRGPVRSPSVSVNPLSILTPGTFREIFRRPPPSR